MNALPFRMPRLLLAAGLLTAIALPALAAPRQVYNGDKYLNSLKLPKPYKNFDVHGTQLDAYRAATRFVRARLKRQALAAMSDYHSSIVEPVKGRADTFSVNGSYGRFNQAGGVTEVNYTAQVHFDHDDGKWYLQKLGFGQPQYTQQAATPPPPFGQ